MVEQSQDIDTSKKEPGMGSQDLAYLHGPTAASNLVNVPCIRDILSNPDTNPANESTATSVCLLSIVQDSMREAQRTKPDATIRDAIDTLKNPEAKFYETVWAAMAYSQRYGGETGLINGAFPELVAHKQTDFASVISGTSAAKNYYQLDALSRTGQLNQVDANKDSIWTRAEVNGALEGYKLTSSFNKTMGFSVGGDWVKHGYENLANLTGNNGITVADLSSIMETNSRAMNTESVMRANYIATGLIDALVEPPSGAIESVSEVRPEAVNQGAIGDCYLESALGSLAAIDPARIVEMVKAKPEGGYSVTFPGNLVKTADGYKTQAAPDGVQVDVKSPTVAEMTLFNRPNQNGNWASVIESGFGELRKNALMASDLVSELPEPLTQLPKLSKLHAIQSNFNQVFADGGGEWNLGIEVLTGHRAMVVGSGESNLASVLQSAVAEHRILQASEKTETVAHSHSILGFDATGPDGGTVYGRDPRGNFLPDKSGAWSMSLSQFQRQFFAVQVETNVPLVLASK